GPRCWSRKKRTWASSHARRIACTVASSSGSARSTPDTSAPSAPAMGRTVITGRTSATASPRVLEPHRALAHAVDGELGHVGPGVVAHRIEVLALLAYPAVLDLGHAEGFLLHHGLDHPLPIGAGQARAPVVQHRRTGGHDRRVLRRVGGDV